MLSLHNGDKQKESERPTLEDTRITASNVGIVRIVLAVLPPLFAIAFLIALMLNYKDKVDNLEQESAALKEQVNRQEAKIDILVNELGLIPITRTPNNETDEAVTYGSRGLQSTYQRARSVWVERAIAGKGEEWIDVTRQVSALCLGNPVCRVSVPVTDLVRGDLSSRPALEMLIDWRCLTSGDQITPGREPNLQPPITANNGEFEIIAACP